MAFRNKKIYIYFNLAPRLGGIKQNIENGLLPERQGLLRLLLQQKSRKPNNIAYKSSDDHNMGLDKQS